MEKIVRFLATRKTHVCFLNKVIWFIRRVETVLGRHKPRLANVFLTQFAINWTWYDSRSNITLCLWCRLQTNQQIIHSAWKKNQKCRRNKSVHWDYVSLVSDIICWVDDDRKKLTEVLTTISTSCFVCAHMRGGKESQSGWHKVREPGNRVPR